MHRPVRTPEAERKGIGRNGSTDGNGKNRQSNETTVEEEGPTPRNQSPKSPSQPTNMETAILAVKEALSGLQEEISKVPSTIESDDIWHIQECDAAISAAWRTTLSTLQDLRSLNNTGEEARGLNEEANRCATPTVKALKSLRSAETRLRSHLKVEEDEEPTKNEEEVGPETNWAEYQEAHQVQLQEQEVEEEEEREEKYRKNDKSSCIFCRRVGHPEKDCNIVRAIEERRLIVQEEGRCFRCLKHGHRAGDCWWRCRNCDRGHHEALCRAPTAWHANERRKGEPRERGTGDQRRPRNLVTVKDRQEEREEHRGRRSNQGVPKEFYTSRYQGETRRETTRRNRESSERMIDGTTR